MASTTSGKPVRVALVTGCADPAGIGAAMALAYLRDGYKVFATARSLEGMAALKDAGCDLLILDISKADSINAAVNAVFESSGGRLNVLVNNAAATGRSPLLDLDIEAAKRVFDVNVWGTIATIQAFAPLLVETANPEGVDSNNHGHAVIVNIGSLAAVLPYPLGSTYAASKAALHAYGEALKLEMKPLNVHVVTVLAGTVQTNMLAGRKAVDLRKTEVRDDSPFYGNSFNVLWETSRNLQQHRKAMTPETFAKTVVNTTNANYPPRRLFLGNFSFLLRWVLPFVPASLIERIMARRFNLQALQYGFSRKNR